MTICICLWLAGWPLLRTNSLLEYCQILAIVPSTTVVEPIDPWCHFETGKTVFFSMIWIMIMLLLSLQCYFTLKLDLDGEKDHM